MEILLRLILITVRVVGLLLCQLKCILDFLRPHSAEAATAPPINEHLLTLSMRDLRARLRTRQLSAVELVGAYIAQIEAVNPLLNAVVEQRFQAALRDAVAADELIAKHEDHELEQLFAKHPLLGLPVTVKESCALRGMPFAVGSRSRARMRADADGAAVARVRAAGAIPLLVSATPEFCYSIETATFQNGCCRNPYDLARTSGGSSGGEGALNGAGATLFGIGSDIAGSIRIPSLFCGVFGHKPSGGLVSVVGHFPDSSDTQFAQFMQVGPMSRFAGDLTELLAIMAGDSMAAKLRLRQPVQLDQLKVHYAFGFEGINGIMHQPVDGDIQYVIRKALMHLESLGLPVQHAKLGGMHNSLEIALSGIARLGNMSFLMPAQSTLRQTLLEFLRSLVGRSSHTTNALIFELMRRANAFMPQHQHKQYELEAQALIEEFTQLLGEDGVMLFPTLHTTAPRHKMTLLPLWCIDYTAIFNILGMPATHVPMGLNALGLPIGFSVIAAPGQDRLCLRLAEELERAFGGWQPPTPHELGVEHL